MRGILTHPGAFSIGSSSLEGVSTDLSNSCTVKFVHFKQILALGGYQTILLTHSFPEKTAQGLYQLLQTGETAELTDGVCCCLVPDLTIPRHHLPGEPLQRGPAEGHGPAHDQHPAGHALGCPSRWKQIPVSLPRGKQGKFLPSEG